MAERVTQLPVEVIGSADPDIRLTQLPAEVLGQGDPDVRLTQLPIEVLGSPDLDDVFVRLTQLPVEVLGSPDDVDVFVRLTQLPVEVLGSPNPNARVTQYYLEVLGSNVGCAVADITTPSFVPNPGTLEVTVTWNSNVVVTGFPQIDVLLDSGLITATYSSGSGTDTHIYTYTLTADDFNDADIEFIGPIDLNGGTLTCGAFASELTFDISRQTITVIPRSLGECPFLVHATIRVEV